MGKIHHKAYQAMCREQIKAGRINDAGRKFVPVASPPTTIQHHVLAGWHFAGHMSGKKRGRKAKED